MGLLDRHVSILKSEEYVLGASHGFRGESDSKFSGIESTKLSIVASPASKNWSGYTSVDQKMADASIGESLKDRQFPAKCLISYKRVTSSQNQVVDGRAVVKDVEMLVVVNVEYICPVDFQDAKLTGKGA